MAVNQEMIAYKCFFNYAIVNQILKQLVDLEKTGQIDPSAFKKIQIVMVEMLENSYSYTSGFVNEFQYEKYVPEFKIVKLDNAYQLISSNPVIKSDAYTLSMHIEKINQSSLDDLRRWYKKILIDGIHSRKISAGIGLLRIAKVIRNKFKYSFRKIDNKFLYYTLEILIYTK